MIEQRNGGMDEWMMGRKVDRWMINRLLDE